MATYVLVHGAWHTGKELEAVAAHVSAAGHDVHCPTIAGNGPDDPRTSGLEEAITSIVDFLADNDLHDVVLVGHSYGGMVITGVADRVPDRLRRLVYWCAFVPNDGECLNDLVPGHYIEMFDALSAQSDDNSVMLPEPIWREAFINDGSAQQAADAFALLNPHPYATFTDPISLSTNPAEMELPKSYIHCTDDTALPQSLGWHPRMSERLGLFRLVTMPGSHEVCFTDPEGLARAVMTAGRD